MVKFQILVMLYMHIVSCSTYAVTIWHNEQGVGRTFWKTSLFFCSLLLILALIIHFVRRGSFPSEKKGPSVVNKSETNSPFTLNVEKFEPLKAETKQMGPHVDHRKRMAILLDDNIWLREAWLERAQTLGVPLIAFDDSQKLLNHLSSLTQDSLFFLDSELDQNQKGEDIAGLLYSERFRQIYICSGKPADAFAHVHSVQGIMGKEFPERLLSKVFLGHGSLV